MKNINLTDHFLIAMPNLADPFFAKTLTYICEHNEHGALGLVINRPTELTVEKLFEQLGIPLTGSFPPGRFVLFGGPVQIDSGFVLHQPVGKWKSTLAVNQTVGLTSSVDILEAIANCEGPEQILVTLGYSGWAPGQLEQELAQNAWLTVPASSNIIFEMSFEERLPAAAQLLGINFSNLSNDVGHA
ncbi:MULTISPECIES: YqgE/AlgH family protein [unclassified Nitrosomonas]|uniref:YqgE/AlgH family protein n=1 Tax=unclassified Nitrosomonas TaxID=2609265 RepID=UPI000894892F|nr:MULTISPECIES: YqgE/AlgH family protein [unclassified Nitrosomonas]MDV6343679.1 YqgE/AlgH family protein [Nitrosomonas sp. Is37]SDY35258.1 putative transcriptional regulator [Nitrosomonas sp. Nm33]